MKAQRKCKICGQYLDVHPTKQVEFGDQQMSVLDCESIREKVRGA